MFTAVFEYQVQSLISFQTAPPRHFPIGISPFSFLETTIVSKRSYNALHKHFPGSLFRIESYHKKSNDYYLALPISQPECKSIRLLSCPSDTIIGSRKASPLTRQPLESTRSPFTIIASLPQLEAATLHQISSPRQRD